MEMVSQVPTTIYTLSCPISKQVKYVGKTVKTLNERLSDHLADSKRSFNKRSNWIKSLLRKGVLPVIEPIEIVYIEWEMAEQYWISQFRAWGFDLKNMTSGGDGVPGRQVSIITRQKISAFHKGKKHSPEHIKKSVLARLKNGSYATNDMIRRKQSLALMGKPKTAEHNLKVSIANKGKPKSEEFKNKCRARMLGKRQKSIMVPVFQSTMDGVLIRGFECIRDAKSATGILETSIHNCLTGRSKSAGGYKWTYQNNAAR